MGETDRARRWYDSSKVIWSLISLICVLGAAISGTIWAAASAAKDASAEHAGDIKVLKIQIDAHDNAIKDCNRKLDLLLWHHGIKDEKK